MSADDDNMPEHPALKNYSPAQERAKHTLKSAVGGALKGAMIGAAVLGGIVLVATAMLGLSVAAIPFIGVPLAGAAAYFGSGGILAALGGAALTGAMWGGGLGAAIGGVKGAMDSQDAADDEADRRIAAYERREVREERMAMVQQRREQQRLAMAQQAQSMGLTPGLNLPFGPGSNERQV